MVADIFEIEVGMSLHLSQDTDPADHVIRRITLKTYILSGHNFIFAYNPTHPPSLKAVGFLAALWCYF
jgi:hypothetical protein